MGNCSPPPHFQSGDVLRSKINESRIEDAPIVKGQEQKGKASGRSQDKSKVLGSGV